VAQEPAGPAAGPAESPPAAAPESSYFLWSDNSISILPYGWNYEVDPSHQSTITFEHVHESAIGDVFIFLDATAFHDSTVSDSWYGEISPRLSLGKVSGRDLSFTLFEHSLFDVKDVLLAAQYERGEDGDVAEAALLGVGFDLDVREAGLLGPLGKFQFIQLNFYARSELIEGVKHGFRDLQVTMVAARPFTMGRSRFLLDGYFDWVLGFGSEDWSYHLNPQFTLDIGNFRGMPEKFYAGIEVDLWWNKYQIPDSAAFDTNQAAWSLLVKYHF
jgi:nucleoside-specific outer membrane channel protein Tsx